MHRPQNMTHFMRECRVIAEVTSFTHRQWIPMHRRHIQASPGETPIHADVGDAARASRPQGLIRIAITKSAAKSARSWSMVEKGPSP